MLERRTASRAGRPSVPQRVKAKTSGPWLPPAAPAHRHGPALTRWGRGWLTRIGSRERGAGCDRRWADSKAEGQRRHSRRSSRFGNRLGDSGGVCRSLLGKEVAPFFVSTSQVLLVFSLAIGPLF